MKLISWNQVFWAQKWGTCPHHPEISIVTDILCNFISNQSSQTQSYLTSCGSQASTHFSPCLSPFLCPLKCQQCWGTKFHLFFITNYRLLQMVLFKQVVPSTVWTTDLKISVSVLQTYVPTDKLDGSMECWMDASYITWPKGIVFIPFSKLIFLTPKQMLILAFKWFLEDLGTWLILDFFCLSLSSFSNESLSLKFIPLFYPLSKHALCYPHYTHL